MREKENSKEGSEKGREGEYVRGREGEMRNIGGHNAVSSKSPPSVMSNSSIDSVS